MLYPCCYCFLITYFLVLTSPSVILGKFYNSTDENALLNHVRNELTFYTPHALMSNNSVFVGLDVYKIVDTDEKDGLIALMTYFHIYYYVESVKWNVSANGVKFLSFPYRTFWLPDLVPFDVVDVLHESFYSQFVRGDIGMVAARSSLVTMRFTCTFDVTNFPFDEQTCPIHIGQWASDTSQYRIGLDKKLNMKKEIPLFNYKENDQWALIKPIKYRIETRSLKFREYDTMVIDIRIKRHSRFHVIIFIIPTVVLYILSTFVFHLPAESGEKLTLSITILLAEIVTLDIISATVPASSSNFPVLGYFVVVVIIQMSFAIFSSILVINVHNLGCIHDMPLLFRRMISRKLLYLVMMTPCPVEKAMMPKPHMKTILKLKNHMSANFPTNNSLAVKTNEKLDESIAMLEKEAQHLNEYEENTARLWKFFAILLDRIFFILYCIATIVNLYIFSSKIPPGAIS